ncbi:hypothetical protein [Actinocatenispora rupis]|uniref:Uncharacterized protein n=1 Tax=Actinocatenispora rupis TaxID=519421 RepID=A0A8J3JCR2_9ACTN|nr:hypothetical protein [Actinocatenispora rupis]GID16000.1 hypothetical protein Aru02nite_68890 [Actinocatenispora rupis]
MTRHDVAALACPALAGIRTAYCSAESAEARAAALVEIAGAASALARTISRYRHVDPRSVLGLVSRPEDVAPVFGRGRWLPTMTFHVPASSPVQPVRRNRTAARVRVTVVQPALFQTTTAVGGAR